MATLAVVVESIRVTPRERQVLQLLAEGFNMREAGEELGISHKTVRNLMQTAKDRVDQRTLAGTVAIGLREGWLH